MTVCSGIGAPEVAAPWIDWCYQSEIEAFPSAVLAHRFPDAVNLGDMTKFKEWPDAVVDVLVGGTPCQSFSVAGLRKGLDDPRGNLTLTFLEIARRYKPQYIVWENVPGVVSDKDDALGKFMEGLNSLGYAIDCDILDAQHFGLAQRRRRVFFVCHNIAIGRQKKTPLFANATGQFLSEMLLSVLAEASDPSRVGADVSDWPARITRAGLMPKMRCFGAASETPPTPNGLTAFLTKLHSDWTEALNRFASGPNIWDSSFEMGCDPAAAGTPGVASSGLRVDRQSSNTAPSWSDISAVVCDLMSTSTTLTATRTITPSTIYICAQASLSIVQSIIKSTTSPANYFDGDGSGLTALRAFTGYARQAANDLFGNLDGLCDWHDFIAEAEGAIRELERSLGDRAHTGTLFSNPKGLRWYSPPRREAREVAPTVPSRSTGGGGLGTDFDCDGGLIAQDVTPTLNAHFGDKMGLENQHIDGGCGLFVAHALRGEGFDASEDGTGRGTPLVPVAIQERAVAENPDAGPDGKGYRQDGASYTLEARTVPQAVAFAQNQRGELRESDVSLQRTTGGGKPGEGYPAVRDGYAVRRLTPTECERLMGFPDGWTAIPYRNKPADQCPDGPRYKALGNSWAVNCGEFIFDRMRAVEAMSAEQVEAAE